MRKFVLVLVAALLLAGCLAAAPAGARSVTAPAEGVVARASSGDPLIGNWYRGKMWFSVKPPNAYGKYRVSWSNGSGPRIRYTIERRVDGVYFETMNHKNTYTMANSYTVSVHYRTTAHKYVTRRFMRVE